MRSIPCLGLLFASLAFALDVDSLPVWDPSILERNALENAPEATSPVATMNAPEAEDSSRAEIETHGYKTMQVTVGDNAPGSGPDLFSGGISVCDVAFGRFDVDGQFDGTYVV